MTRAPHAYYLPDDADEPAPIKKRAKRVDREASVQAPIVRFLELSLRDAVVHHSPNGAHLAGDATQRAIQIRKLKAQGMKVGFPDILIWWRGQFWTMETKVPRGKGPTEAQIRIGEQIERNGGRWAVVRSVTDAEDAIREWRGDL